MLSARPNFRWYEWLCHSNYSFLKGGSAPADYIERAAQLAYPGVGFCDSDGVYGLVRAHEARKNLAPHLRLFHGIEFTLDREEHAHSLTQQKTLVLYARNLAGYQQLCALSTYAHRDGKIDPSLPWAYLREQDLSQLHALQPMRGWIRRHPLEETALHYRDIKEVFGDRCHLILSRHLNPAEDRFIRPTLELSRRLEMKTLFSQDVYFHEPGQKAIHDLLQSIRLNQTIETIVPQLFVNTERCLRDLATLEQRYRAFSDFPKILLESERLAEQITFDLSELRYHYPREFIPEGYDAQRFLKKLVWEGAHARHGLTVPDKTTSLIHKELSLIGDLGYADYFLTVWDIVRWARSQKILCQGRGSAANSVICFLLGITSLDPETTDMLFERFLNRERGDPPDIDVDFEHERREEVIQYIYGRYGRERAAMVANVISFQTRGALRAVGKALGVPEVWIQEVSKQRRENTIPEDLQKEIAPYCSWPTWWSLSEAIYGFPRHLGIHSGGFVLSHAPLDQICAQEPASMPGRSVLQWSKDDIEALGLFKIDVLALGMLTALRKMLETLQTDYGVTLDLSTIPAEDPKTYAMIQRAETVGTFQIESRAQMSMLPRLRPRTFYDIVVQIGIIRPGPIQGGLIHPYIRRRRGMEPVEYPYPELRPILERTYGVPIFQEQIMRVAMEVGDFTASEADTLRKKIGAWSMQKDLGSIRQKLGEGMRRRNLDPAFIEQLLSYLQGFAEYGFPESHAVSFALLAYASSYLKCHHTAVFYLGLINSQPMGFYSIHALIQSARREGVRFLPIDINHSHWDSKLERLADGERALRLGFHLVRGLSQDGVARLLSQRTEPWRVLQDCLKAAEGISRKDLSALAAAHAFIGFGLPRREALWLMESFPRAPLLDEEIAYSFSPETALERVERDFEAFSSTLDQHPCALLKRLDWRYPQPVQRLVPAHQLTQKAGGSFVQVFGMVLMRQSPPTAKGVMFITLEDETGLINLIIKPKIVERYRTLLRQHSFLCVTARVQKDLESVSLLVQQVHEAQSTVRSLEEFTLKWRAGGGEWEKGPPVRSFR